jgi:hypothetical protein
MEAVAVSGRRQSLLGESKVVLLHLAASLSFSKSSFPGTEKVRLDPVRRIFVL